jgi:hypothetical protein
MEVHNHFERLGQVGGCNSILHMMLESETLAEICQLSQINRRILQHEQTLAETYKSDKPGCSSHRPHHLIEMSSDA